MGTITKRVQQRMERFRQTQMKLDELTQLGWEDAADHFRERDRKYSKSKLTVPAVVQSQMDEDAVAPAPTTFGEIMECLDIAHGISQMLQGTSRLGCTYMRLGSQKPQSNTNIPGLVTPTEQDSSVIQNVKPVELVRRYPCIYPRKPITI